MVFFLLHYRMSNPQKAILTITIKKLSVKCFKAKKRAIAIAPDCSWLSNGKEWVQCDKEHDI